MNFDAPLSLNVKLVSTLAFSLIFIVLCVLIKSIIEDMSYVSFFIFIFIFGITIDGIFRQVVTYRITNEALEIRKRWGVKRCKISEIIEMDLDGNPIWNSTRLFGVGGVLGFHGRFKHRDGRYFSAYVSDSKNCIMIRLKTGWIAISPSEQKMFLKELCARAPHLIK